MTILPKKKTGKEKTETESRPSGEHGHLTHAQSTETRVSRRNSPPRWTSPTSRDDVRSGTHDPGPRYDEYSTHEGSSGHNKRRHRSSPHRTVRKHRHDRQTSNRESKTGVPTSVATVPHPHPAHPLPHSQHTTHAHRHSYEPTTYIATAAPASTQAEDVELGDIEECNSGDEYVAPKNVENIDEFEKLFRKSLKEKRGFIIKEMGDDGACLFRAVADQVYGDQEMHGVVRKSVIDYMAKNSDFFKQYVTEDFNRYLSRKRCDQCHGNHVEIQAVCELFNRQVEVFQYSTEPINTFHSTGESDNVPIRVSYHRNIHYNSVVDPYNATIGVGLGLPGLHPGAADKNLMHDAVKKSEDFHIEQTMLEDKLRETDWEVTQETIEEQVARESYLQWLRDQEKRATRHTAPHSATAACSSSTDLQQGWWDSLSSSQCSPEPRTSRSPRHSPAVSAQSSPKQPQQHTETRTELPEHETQVLPGATVSSKSPLSSSSPGEGCSHSVPVEEATGGATLGARFSETTSLMNDLPAHMFGLSDYNEDDILAQVMAQSHQEYLDSLRLSGPSSNSASTSGASCMTAPPGSSSDS